MFSKSSPPNDDPSNAEEKKEAVGKGADRDTRGRVCSLANLAPILSSLLKYPTERRVGARGLQSFLGHHGTCRPGVLTGRILQQAVRRGFGPAAGSCAGGEKPIRCKGVNQSADRNPPVAAPESRVGASALGLNPYPSRSQRTHYAKTILDDFAALEGTTATVAGRLMSWRKQGALAFAHIQDQTGRLQLFCRRNLVQPTDKATGSLGYAETNMLDLGDIIEATGKVVRTERGEISVLVEHPAPADQGAAPAAGPMVRA